MLRRIAIAGVTVALLAGCGGSSSSSRARTISLTRAAYVSSGAPGYKALISLRENIPNAGEVTMRASGRFSATSHAGSMTMQMNLPSAQAAQAGVGSLQMQAVFAGQTFYMKLPATIADKLPGGKPWWKFNLSEAGKMAGIPGLSSLMSGTSSVNNPGQYLDFLRATASGSVRNLGPATVDGVRTTHYRAAIDFAKLPHAVPPSDRAGVEQMIAALQSQGELVRRLPVDVWIDSSNLIRRYEMTYDQPLGTGVAARVAMRADFVDYGPQPAPRLPPRSQTLDLLALLQHQGL